MTGVVFFVLCIALWMWCRSSTTSTPSARYMAKGGPCGFCGTHSPMLAAHEAGHVAAARSLEYRVSGAVVRNNGTGYTAIPGWLDNPRHTMIIAAAGTSGENRDRWTDAGLNGSRSAAGSDAWWVHQLAGEEAKRRGVSKADVIKRVRAEADRRVASRSREWAQTKGVLGRDGKFGDV